jgi:hypothetical protein
MAEGEQKPLPSAGSRRLTPRQLFEIAVTSLSTQYDRVRGRLGKDEAQEMRNSIERLRVYHQVTWPEDPEDKPLT